MKVAQLCTTLCHPMDYKVRGILQARILEWVAFPISRGSSQPRPGEFHGLYSPWGCKELDTTEHLSLLTYHNQVNKRLMHTAEKISLLMYKNCKNVTHIGGNFLVAVQSLSCV